MTTNAIAVALADRRAREVTKVMKRDWLPFAFRLAALNAMGGENRTM